MLLKHLDTSSAPRRHTHDSSFGQFGSFGDGDDDDDEYDYDDEYYDMDSEEEEELSYYM